MPVPLPNSLVVKNGSNIWAFVFASMPQPVSVTASITCGPGSVEAAGRHTRSSSSTFEVSMVSLPPAGMASRAFTARFMMILFDLSRIGSYPAERGVQHDQQLDILTDQPLKQISPCQRQLALRSSTLGWSTCLRLKARSWRVNNAARSPAFWISSILLALRIFQTQDLRARARCSRG